MDYFRPETYEGYIIRFDTIDAENEFFSTKTNFWEEYFTPKLITYHHMEGHPLSNLDFPEIYAIGEITETFRDAKGIKAKFKLYEKMPLHLKQLIDNWTDELDEFHQYWLSIIQDKLSEGKLGFSSDSIDRMIKRQQVGPNVEIKSWPLLWVSLTPTPAEPNNLVNIHSVKLLKDNQSRVISTSTQNDILLNTNNDNKELDSMEKPTEEKMNEKPTEEKMDKPMDEQKGLPPALQAVLQPVLDEMMNTLGMSETDAMEVISGVLNKMLSSGSLEAAVESDDAMMYDEEKAEMEEEEEEAAVTTLRGTTKSFNSDDLAEKIFSQLSKKINNKGAYAVKTANVAEKNIYINRKLYPDSTPLLNLIRAQIRNDHKSLKAMGTMPGSAGGYAVQVEQSQDMVEALISRSIFMGDTNTPRATFMPMVSDTLDVPVMESGTEAYWVGENQSITESQPDTAQRQLVAKKLAILIPVSNELLADAIPAFETQLRNDMVRYMQAAVDRAILTGTGGSQPLGLAYRNDVTQTPLNANAGYGDLVAAIARLENADVELDDSLMWVFNYNVKSNLRTLVDGLGQYIFTDTIGLGNQAVGGVPNQLLGIPWTASSTVVAGTNGNSATETNIFLGKWSDLIVGMRQSIEIEASNVAGNSFANYQTLIRAVLRMDVNVKHPESFQILSDVTWA